MSDIEVNGIEIEIYGETISLSIEAAKKLRDQLNDLFGYPEMIGGEWQQSSDKWQPISVPLAPPDIGHWVQWTY